MQEELAVGLAHGDLTGHAEEGEAAAREPLRDYFKKIFISTQYKAPVYFRGFYFTSGLQEGKPIAKACDAMIKSTGGQSEGIIENLAKAFENSKMAVYMKIVMDLV